MAEIQSSRYKGVFTDGRDYFTLNFVPGRQVYGEKLITQGGREYRRWDPYRSKLAALLQKVPPIWPFTENTETLYLGAASGTTVSHISDICPSGRMFCVEMSPRVFRKLLDVASERPNMTPFLGDASLPVAYKRFVHPVDVLYQDIAQRDQVLIFVKNLSFLKKDGHGFLMVKARSVDVTARPEDVYRRAISELSSAGFRVLATIRLHPFEKDHAAILISGGSGQA